MADINTIIEEAQLMKQNRADLVKTLNEVGFSQVNQDTPLSDIAKYMQWAGGLLDIRLATFSKSTKQHRYWTYEEWMDQSAQTRSSYIQMGVVVRAERQEFIIAKNNLTSDTGTTTMQWAPNNNNDVRGLPNYYGLSTLLSDIDGEANTNLILAAIEANGIDYPAARRAREYRCCSLADGGVEDPTIWSLPAVGQLWLFYKYSLEINAALTLFGMATISADWYWSSTECNSSLAWIVFMTYGYVIITYKANPYRARAVAPVQPSSATPQGVYDIPFSTIIEAWIDCERNKRSSNSCTKFRWHAARDLVALWHQMCEGRYEPLTSMCFMVTVPVLREVWAGAFRDRVAHHWENLRFGPVIEKYFVEVGDCSMNCRKGYGSLRAVYTMQKAIYEFTEGYTRDDCYIVGGDFANFFMSVDKSLLWEYLEHIIMDEYVGEDKSALLYMMKTTLFHRCQDKFFRRSHVSMWNNLPPRKSLFHMDGMPIGNLPSQIWANFLGAIFTMWIIFVKKIQGFLIFVDDWRCLVRSREEGRRLISEIKTFLADELHITLHPDKIYLQHYTKGTKMVGAVIKPPCRNYTTLNRIKEMRKWMNRGFDGKINVKKFSRFLLGAFKSGSAPRSLSPGRVYIANRTRGHFISAMIAFNKEGDTHKARVALLEKLRAAINSYLGLMCHYNSYKVRRKICTQYILPTWGKYIYFEDEFRKCVIRREYDKIHVVRKKLKNHHYAAKFIRPKWVPDE